MRAGVAAIFLTALAVFGGCTSTGDYEDGCYDDSDCASGYVCDASIGICAAPVDGSGGGGDACRAPTDCSASYTCSPQGRCQPGDCYFHGCVTGFECRSSTGTWECLASSG